LHSGTTSADFNQYFLHNGTPPLKTTDKMSTRLQLKSAIIDSFWSVMQVISLL